jgi:hypothetical protein
MSLPAAFADPKVFPLSAGDRCDLVVRLHQEGGTQHARGLAWGERLRLVHDQMLPAGTYTLWGAIRGPDEDGLPTLSFDSATKVLPRPGCTRSAFATLKEVCAGMGGISLGASEVGCVCLAFLDKSRLACDAIAANSGLSIHADLADRDARVHLHSVQPAQACILTAGIPCQSYSCRTREDRPCSRSYAPPGNSRYTG